MCNNRLDDVATVHSFKFDPRDLYQWLRFLRTSFVKEEKDDRLYRSGAIMMER